MKKILAFVAALALVFGIGAGVKKAIDEAGDPPIGGFTAESVETAQIDFTSYGNPPIGG
jgi:hypothetical protein